MRSIEQKGPAVAISPKKNLLSCFFSPLTAVASSTVIIFIIGVFWVLVRESSLAISKFGCSAVPVLDGMEPREGMFGAATNIYGTFITTGLALLFAVPSAIGIAIFVTEVAPNFLKGPIGIAIELLAAIPSIIYGMWGLFTLAPIMSKYIEPALKVSLRKAAPRLEILFRGHSPGDRYPDRKHYPFHHDHPLYGEHRAGLLQSDALRGQGIGLCHRRHAVGSGEECGAPLLQARRVRRASCFPWAGRWARPWLLPSCSGTTIR